VAPGSVLSGNQHISGTESGPHSIGAAAGFILNLNHANVAFSRTQERLIVVCADTLLDHIPPELEDYESAMLWKSLRNLCSRVVFRAAVQGHAVRVLAPPIRQPDAPALAARDGRVTD
jgi:hypothetical protein